MTDEIQNASVSKIKGLLDLILHHGLEGLGPLADAESLAQEYLSNESFTSNKERIDSLIKWEATKNFSAGFFSGLGGISTMALSIPASIVASWVIQTRLAGAIAVIQGYDLEDEKVKSFVLLSILGESGMEILKSTGTTAAGNLIASALKNISPQIITEINKKVGFALLARGSEKGVVNIMKAVPVAGGVISGVVDAVSSVIVGLTAKKIFMIKGGDQIDDNHIYNIRLSSEQLSTIIKSQAPEIKSLKIPRDNILEFNVKGLPFSIVFSFLAYNEGFIRLKIENNFIVRGFVQKVLDHHLKNAGDLINGIILHKEDRISIHIDSVLKGGGLGNLEIDDIQIKKNELRIKLS